MRKIKSITLDGRPVKEIKMGGGIMFGKSNNYAELLPQWARESIVLWYDVDKQGCTNDSLAADPRLIDLSGNGQDAELVDFTPCVILYGKSTSLKLNPTYGHCRLTRNTDNPTVIVHRRYLPLQAHRYETVVGTNTAPGYGWYIEQYENNAIASGSLTHSFQGLVSSDYTWMTPNQYNGQVGTTASPRPNANDLYIGLMRPGFAVCNMYFYSMMLFDGELTLDQINWLIDNLM